MKLIFLILTVASIVYNTNTEFTDSADIQFIYDPATFKFSPPTNISKSITDNTASLYDFTNVGVDCNLEGAVSKITYTVDQNTLITYQCYQITDNILNLYSKDSGWNEVFSDIKKSAHYLDRHNIQCDDDSVLNQYQLKSGDNKIRFEYKCARLVKELLVCEDKSSPRKTLGSWTNIELNTLSLGNGNKLIQRFQLRINWSNMKNEIWFDYRECIYHPVHSIDKIR